MALVQPLFKQPTVVQRALVSVYAPITESANSTNGISSGCIIRNILPFSQDIQVPV